MDIVSAPSKKLCLEGPGEMDDLDCLMISEASDLGPH